MNTVPRPDNTGLRNFAFILAAMIAGIFGIVLPWLFGLSFSLWPWGLAVMLAAWAIIAPAGLSPLYSVWMRLGLLMNRIVTPVVLGLVFLGILTPLGWIMRIFSKSSLGLRMDGGADSYRVESRERNRRDMEKPF